MPKRRARRLLIGFLGAAVVTAGAPWGIRWLLWRWEQNPILRGRLLAEKAGCLTCHRPFAGTEIPNPGSRWGSVPSFQSGNPRMYDATERGSIEDYIRFGAPREWLDDSAVRQRLASQHMRMPAYEDLLSDKKIADLVAFTGAVERVELPGGEDAQAGRALARKHGCLSCHGVEGSGGLPNPGSLGGFVPGFLGRNFTHLVQDEAEFREWILEGSLSRVADNPLVLYFWRRQRLTMPAYGGHLDDQELAHLWAWVRAIRAPAGA